MISKSFEKLYDIIKKLRGPDGCPWDKEQDPSSLRGALIEETYECIEAIDENNAEHIKEELGDIYLLVTMLSYMFEQEKNFSVDSVLDGIAEKLIRRHPHVFGDEHVKNSGEVLKNWNRIKIEKEGRKPKDSLMDEVSRALPPLDRAYKLQKKAAAAGFDWPSLESIFSKIFEECDEVREETVKNTDKSALEGELGDLLFAVIDLCRFLKVEPSVALQRTTNKFIERFRHIEKRMRETNTPMEQSNFTLMNTFWGEAKNELSTATKHK
jgi:MazG family protein